MGTAVMFRIHIDRSGESTRFTIEGKLTGLSTEELENCWRAEASNDPAKPIVVSLAAVSFVDPGGVDLLSRMRRQGATLVARGCLMKSLVEDIEARLREERSTGRFDELSSSQSTA